MTTRFSLGSINNFFTQDGDCKADERGASLALTDTLGVLLPDYPNPAAKARDRRSSFSSIAPASRTSSVRTSTNAEGALPLATPTTTPTSRRSRCSSSRARAVSTATAATSCWALSSSACRACPTRTTSPRTVFTAAGMTATGVFRRDALAARYRAGYTRRSRTGPAAARSSTTCRCTAYRGSARGRRLCSRAAICSPSTSRLRDGRLLDADAHRLDAERRIQSAPAAPRSHRHCRRRAGRERGARIERHVDGRRRQPRSAGGRHVWRRRSIGQLARSRNHMARPSCILVIEDDAVVAETLPLSRAGRLPRRPSVRDGARAAWRARRPVTSHSWCSTGCCRARCGLEVCRRLRRRVDAYPF